MAGGWWGTRGNGVPWGGAYAGAPPWYGSGCLSDGSETPNLGKNKGNLEKVIKLVVFTKITKKEDKFTTFLVFSLWLSALSLAQCPLWLSASMPDRYLYAGQVNTGAGQGLMPERV